MRVMHYSPCLSVLVVLACALGARAQGAGYETPACDGRSVIVHLFEWKWTDVALECERFLSEAGFCGVQVSPPNEHAVITDDYPHPWWQRYQPVSYKLVSRSGTREEFVDMVRRCNDAGVRIFVDAVVNHMVALGRRGKGSAGSSFDADERDFPGVPYHSGDFTPRVLCPSVSGNVDNYSDPYNVRNCYLVSLTDLYGAKDYVRRTVAGYFNELLEIGVAGFRVDASKHMWPEDLMAIMDITNDLNPDHGFPEGTRPFFAHEVIDQNDGAVKVQEYYGMGRITEFRYCQRIARGIRDPEQLRDVFDPELGMADPDRALVFVDNHDNQRGHGGAGDILTHKLPHDYLLAVAFTLAQPYGCARIISSYFFGNDTDAGPPHNSDYSIADVIINSQNQCEGGWVCEHRWETIFKMVRFRNAVSGTGWWDNYYSDGNVVAFSRGDKGFFVMVKQGTVSQTLQTGIPAGMYEDIISCQSVTVNGDGTVQVSITNEDKPVFAICQGCDCSRPSIVTSTAGPGPVKPPSIADHHRTVIFIRKETRYGEDLFVRGGPCISDRQGCTNEISTNPCAIDIKTNSLGETSYYDKYNSWRQGDTKLDWQGAEPGQGSYLGQTASGTPLTWTSNQPGSLGYHELNEWGEHYWIIDIDMDCSQTQNGWFELKAFLTNSLYEWERDISQVTECSGTAGGSAPGTSINHLGRCGHINAFIFGSPQCVINAFPNG